MLQIPSSAWQHSQHAIAADGPGTCLAVGNLVPAVQAGPASRECHPCEVALALHVKHSDRSE